MILQTYLEHEPASILATYIGGCLQKKGTLLQPNVVCTLCHFVLTQWFAVLVMKYLVLQGAEPGDIDLQDALELLAAKQEAQDKKYGNRQTDQNQHTAGLEDHIGSGNKDATSNARLQSSDSSSKEPTARTAALRTARSGGRKASGSSAKEKAQEKRGKVGANGEASSNGKAKSTGRVGTVGAAGKSNVSRKDKSTKVKKSMGKRQSGSAAAATPKPGYRVFWKEQWDKLKADNPSIKMTDGTKQIASVWKHMDAEGKEKYK